METKAKKKKSGILKKILIPLFGVLLIVFAAGFWIASLLFGNVPQLEVAPLQPEDSQLMSKLMGRFTNELLSGDGASEEAKLVLSPGEVNSLIRISERGAGLFGIFSGKGGQTRFKNHNARYENGRFEILAPVKTKLTWLWGGIIMADMSIKPEKDDEKLMLDISRARAGSITLPEFLVRRIQESAVNAVRADKNYQKFEHCVKSLKIDSNHNLHIIYRPRELRKLFFSGRKQQ